MLDTIVAFFNEKPWAAILLTGLAGSFLTAMTIQTQRSINRRRSTFEMLSRVIWDKDYIEASAAFYHIMKDQKLLMKYYDQFSECRSLKNRGEWECLPNSDKEKFEPGISIVTSIRSVLNDRELMAIGIREGTFDEVIYRRWWHSTYVKEWKESSALVARFRSEPTGPGPAAYTEMELLARKWEAEGPWTRRDRHIRFFGRNITVSRSR